MGPSRRNSNGRSPLVNQQRQITSFFTKTPSPSPTLAKTNQKPNPNHDSDSNPSPSSTTLTPSPLNPKPNKSLLVIGASVSPPSASSSLYGQEVVGRRVKVYWPLDKAWYEGSVKSFDKSTSKHVVRYLDDEEESLILAQEKIEWLHESSTKKLKRLRRGFSDIRKMEIDEEELKEESNKGEEEQQDNVNDDDDSNDEDWGKNAASLEDAGDGEEDTDLEDEDEEDVAGSAKGKKVEAKKRKLSATDKLEPAKKSKSGVEVCKGSFKLSVMEPTTNLESKWLN